MNTNTNTIGISVDTWARERLFHAECRMRGMIAENEFRQHRGECPAYNEDAFLRLAEETRMEVQLLTT